ncbi:glycoside hydrolase family 16 protein [Nocardioides yefusunii]|uniref:Family 16 glycosylhydrolase n=1 Tax=Nocardioides yefusunii TaxID=2500546 RepID=A0ABW1R098_9ACTN|nr:glycoside hydrolase family 16 protein [Nocardioides yefusunii]
MSHLARATATAALVGGLSLSLLPGATTTAQAVPGAPVVATALSTGIATPTVAAAKKTAVGYAKLDAVTGTMLPTTPITFTGVLGRLPARKVVLQRVTGSVTSNIATATSRPDGTFTFTGVKLKNSAQVRVVSPAAKVVVDNGRTAHRRYEAAVVKLAAQTKKLKRLKKKKQTPAVRGKVKAQRGVVSAVTRQVKFFEKKLTKTVAIPRAESKTISVSVVARQSVTAAALPAVAQAGPSAAKPAEGHTVAAEFVPARAGRPVSLERLQGDEWTVVSRDVQDRSGHGVFTVADAGTYRVVTQATTEAEAVTSNAVVTRDWTLDFEDTFSGSALDATKWSVQKRSIGTGSRSCASTDASSMKVKNNVLTMGVSKDPKRSAKCVYVDKDGVKHKLPYMRNTQIATEGKYDYRYGVAAARVKVQSAVGMHSAFWSNPNRSMTRNRPDLGVEVDVMEYFGSRTKDNGVAAFVHHLDAKGVTQKVGAEFAETTLMKGPQRFHENFHVFSVEWTPTAYVFRVDGREYHRVTRTVSQVNQHLVLSNLTSSYELVDLKNFGSTAAVDWVRVWQ